MGLDRLATLMPRIKTFIDMLNETQLAYKIFWNQDAVVTVQKHKNDFVGKTKVEISDHKVFSAEYEIMTTGVTYLVDYQIMGSPYVLKEKLN